MKPGRGRSGE